MSSKNKPMNKRRQPTAKRTPWLLLRFGGMGDAMFLTAAARALHEMGYAVDVATNEQSAPLLAHNPYIRNVIIEQRMGPIQSIDNMYPVDLVKDGDVLMPSLGLFERYKAKASAGAKSAELYPFHVTNYFRIIENGSHHPMVWPTQLSDFRNTYDEHLAWAHIDPQSVPADRKRPVYVVTPEEAAWAEGVLKGFPRPLYLVQANASSPVRTFYRTSELLDALKRHPGTIIIWEVNPQNPLQGMWRVVSFKTDATAPDSPSGAGIPFPEHIPPIRATAALIATADMLVSADTCVSHIAEAVKTRHVTYYTSVPAWTRSQYYTHEYTVDARVPLGPRTCKCGIIGRDCPRKIQDSWGCLKKAEKELLKLLQPQQRESLQMPPADAPLDTKGKPPHEHFGMTPEALKQAVNAAVSHYEAMRQSEAYCLADVHLDVAVEEAIKLWGLDPMTPEAE